MEEITLKRDLIAAFCVAAIIHGVIAVADISAVKPMATLKEDTRTFLHLSFVSVVPPPEKEAPKRSTVAALPKQVVKKKKVSENTPHMVKKAVEKKDVVRKDSTTVVRESETPSVDDTPVEPEPAAPSVVSAAPRYEENSPPAYPAIARRRGYEGVVILSVEVYADGTPGAVTVKVSSGHDILDRAAADAVRRWQFRPGIRAGTPISMTVDVPIRFVLKKNGSS
jgi:protein TonB